MASSNGGSRGRARPGGARNRAMMNRAARNILTGRGPTTARGVQNSINRRRARSK